MGTTRGTCVKPIYKESHFPFSLSLHTRQQESFLKQGIEQFATEFQSLGTTSVDDENQQQHEVDNNNNNNHLVKDLETELEELEAQAKELRNELQRERFDRVAERQAASQQLAKLRDTASRDTSKAILAEQLKMDTVRVQLERRLEEQGSELVTARASLRTQAQEITKLRSQVMELEAERSNVWSLFRQSMRVIKKGFGNRLFGGRRRNSNELDSNDKNNNSNAPPTMTRSSTNNNNNNNNNNSFGFNKKRNTSNDPASVIDRVAEKDNDAVVSKDETA